MTMYGELHLMPEHRAHFAFNDKREHLSKVNIPNLANPNQHIDIGLSHGSRNHVIVPDTIKITTKDKKIP